MCVYICCSAASHVQLFETPWTAARQASLSFTISWSLLKLMSIESVMLSSYLIFCRPLLLLPSIFLSNRVFSNKSALHLRWPKYWSFSPASVPTLNIQGWFPLELTDWSPCRIDWSPCSPRDCQESSPIPQFKRSSAFFMAQLSHPYMTTGKTIDLTMCIYKYIFLKRIHVDIHHLYLCIYSMYIAVYIF